MTKLLVEFLREPTHSQAELQRLCGVGPKAVRNAILALMEAGLPLEHEKDHPHVYWSLPRSYRLGRAADGLANADLLARLVARLPRAADRERALSRLWAPPVRPTVEPSSAVQDIADEDLRVIEESIVTQAPVRVGYFTASRGRQAVRVLSVQRISYGPPTRFVAHCHTTHSLKWFRADRCTSPAAIHSETYRQVARVDVERFVHESLDGFHGSTPPTACVLVVREPEAAWAARALPQGASAVAEPIDGGVRIEIHTSAIDVLARFVVGLGDAVELVGPAVLEERVGEILRGARASQKARLNTQPVSPGATGRIGPTRRAQ